MNFLGLSILICFLFFVIYLFISMEVDMARIREQITIGSKWEIWEGDPFKGHNIVEIEDERDGYVKFTKHIYDSNNSLVHSESSSMSKRYFASDLLKTRFKQIQ